MKTKKIFNKRDICLDITINFQPAKKVIYGHSLGELAF